MTFLSLPYQVSIFFLSTNAKGIFCLKSIPFECLVLQLGWGEGADNPEVSLRCLPHRDPTSLLGAPKGVCPNPDTNTMAS